MGEGHRCAFRWAMSGGGMGEPGVSATLATSTFSRGNMLARGLEGSSASETRSRAPGGHSLHGGGASVCLSMGDVGAGGMGEPGVSRGVGH